MIGVKEQRLIEEKMMNNLRPPKLKVKKRKKVEKTRLSLLELLK